MDTLYRACILGRLQDVELSLNGGADVNKIVSGDTLLLCAVSIGLYDIANLLLKQRGINVNFRNRHGNTALHAAARSGNIHIIYALLDAGADILQCRSKRYSSDVKHAFANYFQQKTIELQHIAKLKFPTDIIRRISSYVTSEHQSS
jgi:ankyrin repeat protein